MRVYPGKTVICVGGTRKGGGSPTMGFQQGAKMVAIVTGLYPKGPEVDGQPSLSLLVLAPGALQFYAPMSVPYDASGAEGTWHFIPEEVAEEAEWSKMTEELEKPAKDVELTKQALGVMDEAIEGAIKSMSLPVGKRMAETKGD